MDSDRNLGPQPVGDLLSKHGLRPTDLVDASDDQLTHKMVARAVKGRRLTPRVMWKVLTALNAASGEKYELHELFDYAPIGPRDAEEAGSIEPASDASYSCPSCGERVVVPVNADEPRQQYVEDCPVCCSPVVLQVTIDEDGSVRIDAQAE